jgi:hypothetical protein
MHMMKNVMIAIAFFLLIGSTAYGGWYVGPTVGYSYYAPAPAYAYPAPYVAYSPVYAGPVMAPAPVIVGRPVVVIGPAGKVYIPGRPIRNTVRAVLP